MNAKRKEILNMLAEGKISSEEAEEILQSATPTAAEQARKIVLSISKGIKKSTPAIAQAVVHHTGMDKKKPQGKIARCFDSAASGLDRRGFTFYCKGTRQEYSVDRCGFWTAPRRRPHCSSHAISRLCLPLPSE